jgi:tight adherence protein B
MPGMTLVKFFLITGAMAIVAFVLVFAFTMTLPVAGVGAAIAAYIPYVFITGKGARRHRAYAMQLPEALDFLSRILRAGHSLSTGLQMMGSEMPEPLASEFRRTYDQHSLGQPLEECLKDMATRIESTDFSFFVTAVLIQRQTGGDLSQVLNNISGMIRGRIRLQSYVKAKTAEGRFTGYILVAFPVLMFFIAYTMNPQYSGVLLHTDTGLKLLGVAAALEVIGLIAINKLTTVTV